MLLGVKHNGEHDTTSTDTRDTNRRHRHRSTTMITQVKVRDEVFFTVNRPPVEFILGFPAQQITVRECIRTRVYHEVEEYNAHRPGAFQGLIQPTEAEQTLNGYRLPKNHRINPEAQFQKALVAFERNADILKGLVWLCAEREDREIVRALAGLAISSYRKLPTIGPRCVRVGNACIWALGQMPGAAGIEQLARLKAKIRFGTAQRVIETALAAAAARAGLARDAIEELLVPSYGLQEVGLWREPLGDITAELIVTGTHAVELRWIKADGKRLAAVPRAVREQHAELLKE